MGEEVRRRRVLSLGGAAALGSLAGCANLLGDGGGESTGTNQTTAQGGDEPSLLFSDGFDDESLTAYRVLDGERDQWTVEDHIEGPSAHVTAAGDYGTGMLAPSADRFRWPGSGEIRIDVAVEAEAATQNVRVAFGDPEGGSVWTVTVAVSDQQLRITPPGGQAQAVQKGIELDPAQLHRLSVSVSQSDVDVALDHQEAALLEDPGTLPGGTVAFGMESDGEAGGQSWFDNVRFIGNSG
jgi:hypothetical protein